MDRSTSDSARILDRTAILLAGLCVLHCLALPLVLVTMPLLQQYADSHFHLQMLIFVLPVSVVALVLGYRRHLHTSILLWGFVGMALLLVGATWAHSEVGLIADRICTISGSLVLATTHYLNTRLARHCKTLAA